MENRTRKSSLQVTLAIIGSVAIGGCGPSGPGSHRPSYRNFAECVAEWGEGGCESIGSDSADYSSGHRYYGPYSHSRSVRQSGTSTSASKSGISSSRGGFGLSSSSHGGGRS